jgi:Tfp pilus assembly protein PilO
VRKNRYMLLAFCFVAAVFIFEYAFLSPRAEMMRGSIETQNESLLRDEQFLKDARIASGGISALVNETKDVEKRMIEEKSDFLASAKLQGEVSGIAGKSGLNVVTIRPLAPVKAGRFTEISLYFEGSGDIKQMSEFLKGIEQDKLLIKVAKLSVNIMNMQNPKDLKYKIQVSALARL